MRSFSKLWLLAALACSVAQSAFAIDVVEAAVPQKIADNQLTIGGRTLSLPMGNWNYVAQKKGVVTNTGTFEVKGTHYTVYAMDAKDGEFRSGVQLQLPVSSFHSTGWAPEPCKKVDRALFVDDFNSGFKHPECLTIYKNASHLSKTEDSFYSQARQWAMDQKVKLPGAVYEITYTKYAINEFGAIRVWIAAKDFSGDAAAIAWAQQLQPQLLNFFEKRIKEAAIPSMPDVLGKTAGNQTTGTPQPVTHSSPVPPPTQFAALSDVAAVPKLGENGKTLYQEWLTKPFPRAVAISDKGAIARGYGGKGIETAIQNCEKHGSPCRLYAVDDQVVWTKP